MTTNVNQDFIFCSTNVTKKKKKLLLTLPLLVLSSSTFNLTEMFVMSFVTYTIVLSNKMHMDDAQR